MEADPLMGELGRYSIKEFTTWVLVVPSCRLHNLPNMLTLWVWLAHVWNGGAPSWGDTRMCVCAQTHTHTHTLAEHWGIAGS